MRIRGKNRTIIAIIAVIAVVIAAGSVTTILLVKRAHHKNDVKAADTIAVRFEKKADEWRKSTLDDLGGVHLSGSNFTSVAKKVDVRISKVPKIGSAPAYGEEHSSAYKSAQERESHLTDGLDEVKEAAKTAEKESAWARSARAALSTSVRDILPSGSVRSSKTLRSKVVPRFKEEIKRFRKSTAPKGADEAAKAVEGALKYAMNEFEALAKNIDAQKNYRTSPYKKFDSAGKKVLAFEGEIGSDVAVAIKEFKSGNSGASV